MRVALSDETVNSYAEDMQRGDKFPPIMVYSDGSRYILADGFHRLLAAKQTGATEIECSVESGSADDAFKCALGANRSNGLRRSNADKRYAVTKALEKYPEKNDQAIADLCGVSKSSVNNIRIQFSNLENSPATTHKEGKDGKLYPVSKPRTEPEFKEDKRPDSPPAYVAPDDDDDMPETKQSKPSQPRRRGSFDDWVKYDDAMNIIIQQCEVIQGLSVDSDNIIRARVQFDKVVATLRNAVTKATE